MFKSKIISIVLFWLSASSVPAMATETLINGTFDTDTQGWSGYIGEPGKFEWRTSDADSDPASGSVRKVFNFGALDTSEYTRSFSQCVPAYPGREYHMRAAMNVSASVSADLFPPHDVIFCQLTIDINQYDQAGCQGNEDRFEEEYFNWDIGPLGDWENGTGGWLSTSIGPGTETTNAGTQSLKYIVEAYAEGNITNLEDTSCAISVDNLSLVLLSPDLELSVSSPNTQVVPGEQFTLDTNLNNLSGMLAEDTQVMVAVPSEFSFVYANACPGEISQVGNDLFWLLGDFAGGGSENCSMVFSTDPDARGTINLPVTSVYSPANPDEQEADISNNSDSVDITLIDGLDWRLSLDATPDTLSQGDAAIVEATLFYRGVDTYPAISTTLTLGPGLDYVSHYGCSGNADFNIVTRELSWYNSNYAPDSLRRCNMIVTPSAAAAGGVATIDGQVNHSGTPIDYYPEDNTQQLDINLLIGQTFVVDNFDDLIDSNPGDGLCNTGVAGSLCSLRAAIMESNALVTEETILVPAGDYFLNSPLFTTEENYTDLDISDSVTIRGMDASPAVIHGYDFNTTTDRAMEITAGSGAIVLLENLRITGGLTAGNGGGILHGEGNGRLSLIDVQLDGNEAANGGGLYMQSSASVAGGSVLNNQGADGAGLMAAAPVATDLSLSLTDTTVDGNSATANGGGILMLGVNGGPLSDLNIVRSTISRNDAGTGGGMAWMNTDLSAINMTVSGNIAQSSGGGLFAGRDGNARIASSTITNNEAAPASTTAGLGGGIYVDSGTEVRLRNSILTNNRAQIGSPIAFPYAANCYGDLVSDNYNAIPIMLDSACHVVNESTGDNILTHPDLAPLADNGGPTFTHAFNLGSVGLDEGDPNGCTADPDGDGVYGYSITVDQRSLPREVDGDGDGTARCDQGAYEENNGVVAYRVFANVDEYGTGTISSVAPGIDCPFDCSEYYEAGTTVELIAHPAPGYLVGEWSGACTGTDLNCSFTLTDTTSVSVSFVEEFPCNGSGIQIPMGTKYEAGDSVTCVSSDTLKTQPDVQVLQGADVTYQSPVVSLDFGFTVQGNGLFRVVTP